MQNKNIIWDAFGFFDSGSGIYVHAQSMHRAMSASSGVTPTPICGSGSIFESQKRILLPDATLFPKVCRLKPFWMGRVGALLARTATTGGIFHGLANFNLPTLSSRWKKVLTIHDLIPFIVPESTRLSYRLQFGHYLTRAMSAADAIVCVSKWTFDQVAERFPEARSRLFIIPNGIDDIRTVLERSSNPGASGLRTLTISRFEPYKNIGLLLEMLRMTKSADMQSTLITNSRGLTFVHAQARDLLKSGRLTVYSNVPQPQLRQHFAACDIYLHPSRVEGFCLPAAEALALGIPVVHMSGSATSEVVGPVGKALPSSASAEEWVSACRQVSQLRASPEFTKILSQHVSRLKTWKIAAQELKKLYNDLI